MECYLLKIEYWLLTHLSRSNNIDLEMKNSFIDRTLRISYEEPMMERISYDIPMIFIIFYNTIKRNSLYTICRGSMKIVIRFVSTRSPAKILTFMKYIFALKMFV
jgi:hypothetical protein